MLRPALVVEAAVVVEEEVVAGMGMGMAGDTVPDPVGLPLIL
jgi:hypothetical protein